ncbi:hypothetical protein GCM10010260_29410 [Streptomyces filipinensis]|uniref:DUF3592 domain-containing protein n=1 Tax=Streptomyces filipinensis TaxID=66887 RepID=A0A918IA70_9ACTN|nr:DUF3592 domain-containing protein [Streptomyces filipinensis]GGU92782.1 hypothetical protein GCM10010260_29410 [Streptomyces filipinensis]
MQVEVRGQRGRRWVAFGLIGFGSLFLVIGLILAGLSVSFLTDAKRARGTVVALEWRTDHHSTSHGRRVNDKPMAYPVVRFTSADGTPRTFRDPTGSSPPAYEKGERVEVLYRADSPEDARINGFASLWLLPLIFSGLGLGVAGVGTIIAVVTRKRSRAVHPTRPISAPAVPRR